MKEIFGNKLFWIVFIIVLAIIFFSFLNFSSIYKSEIDILIIPRNISTVDNSSQIIKNINAISHSVLFFEKLVEYHPEISVPSVDILPDGEKLKYWNSELKTEIIKGSGIIKITIYDKDQNRAESLANFVSRDLITVTSNYYNVKTDIDIRIIDKAITKKDNSYSKYILLAASAGASFILTFISFLFSLVKPKRKSSPVNHELSSKIRKNDFDLSNNMSEWKLKNKQEIHKENIFVPENLPIENPVSEENKTNQKKEIWSENNKPTREPTEEEVKERLNMLLSGKL